MDEAKGVRLRRGVHVVRGVTGLGGVAGIERELLAEFESLPGRWLHRVVQNPDPESEPRQLV